MCVNIHRLNPLGGKIPPYTWITNRLSQHFLPRTVVSNGVVLLDNPQRRRGACGIVVYVYDPWFKDFNADSSVVTDICYGPVWTHNWFTENGELTLSCVGSIESDQDKFKRDEVSIVTA
jgi:hypothetical protein